MEIIEALQLLDPRFGDHWTEAGEPRVDVVSELLGRSVSRKEISEAAPDFVRPETADTEEPDETPRDPREINGELAFDDIPVESAGDSYKVDGGPKDPEKRLAWLEDRMAQVSAYVRKGNEALQAMNREYQALQKQVPQPTPAEVFAADRAHYKRTQAMLRANRAERLKMLRESNVDIKALQSVIHPSQLDAAMTRKTGRGGRRPQFHENASSKQEPGTS